MYKRQTLDSTSEGIKETLNKNREPVNQKIEDSRKEIQIKEDKSALLSENKNNTNKENIKHIEINSKGVKKNQIINKIKKTKEIGKICKKKLINTREELEMMKNGLINVFNIPSSE